MHIVILIILALTSGCYSRCHRAQPVDVPRGAIEDALATAANDSTFDPHQLMPKEWWIIFHDEQLSNFIQTALINNPTVQKARAQIYAAHFNAERIRAVLYPHFTLAGDIQRQKLSKTGIIPTAPPPAGTPGIQIPAISGSGIPFYFTLYETLINFSYDFDLWGKNRATLSAALGEVQANIAEEAFAQLALSISVAQVYYQLQIDYLRQEIAAEFVQNRKEYLELVKGRIKRNLDDDRAMYAAQNNLSSAQQTLLQIQGNIAVNEYQLKAYLAGDFDESIVPIQVCRQNIPSVPMPEEVPLHLIAHRPDITAQLWLIESAGLKIEVAEANFYPDFNLAGFIGLQTIHLHKFFWAKSAMYDVEPAFSLPIFDGGLLRAELGTSEINYDLAILQYNDLVLNAAKEVLDGIAVLQNSNSQLAEFSQETLQQSEIAKLTTLRAQHNLNSKLDSLIAEGNVLVSRDQEVIATGNTIFALLSLVKALGGGYDAFCACE